MAANRYVEQRHVHGRSALALTHARGRQTSAAEVAQPATAQANGADPIRQATEQWRAERPDLDPSPMAIFGRIARVFAFQRRAQAAVHQPQGLTHAGFDMLANLRRSGAPHRKTATSLAESSMISTGGITFRMDGLEAAGLIRRVRDPEDRRVVYAELTDEGRALIDQAIEAHLEMEQDLLESLSAREQQELARLLAKVERALVEHLENPDPGRAT